VFGVSATVWRVFYGADFLDESLYAAIAYGFATGARPFIDQVDPHQTAALLVAPYVKLHLALVGDTTGIMLSLRLLWLALNGTTAALWFFLLRKLLDWRLALVAAVCGFAMMPYMIPAPSYNTLAVMFGAMGLSIIGLVVLGSGRTWMLTAAGVLLGLAAFAYPTLVLSSLLAVGGVWWLTRSGRKTALVAAGGLGTAAVLLLYLAPYLSGVPTVLEWSRALGSSVGWFGLGTGGVLGKVLSVFVDGSVSAMKHFSLYIVIAVGVLGVLRQHVPWPLAALLVVSLPFALPSVVAETATRTLLVAASVLLAALVVAFTTRPLPKQQTSPSLRFFRFTLLYGLLSGVLLSATSSNGSLFLGMGAATVLAPSLCVLFQRLLESFEESPTTRDYSAIVSVSLSAFMLIGLVFYNSTGAYLDLPPRELKRLVKSGPHAGLMTTPANAEGSEALWSKMQEVSIRSDRVLSYEGFPAGYLFTEAEPALPNPWLNPYAAMGAPALAASDVRTLSRPEHRPTVIIRNLGWPNDIVYQRQNPGFYDPALDPVDEFVSNNYEVVAEGELWEVLLPQKP